MIDLNIVRDLLDECSTLVDQLQGKDLDESRAIAETNDTSARRERARMSADLRYLAARLQFAAMLVDNEYWVARGRPDPLGPEKGD